MHHGIASERRPLQCGENSKLVKAKKRFRRVEKSYAAMVSRGIAHRVHRYLELKPDVGAPATATLPRSVFKAGDKTCKLDVKPLASVKATPNWYTCTADDIGRGFADISVYHYLQAKKDYGKADMLWLSKLCDHSHTLILQEKATKLWWMPLRNWGDSSVLAWPMHRRTFGKNKFFVFEPMTGLVAPHFITVCDLSEWLAVSYEWRSPHWQKANAPEVFATVPLAVRRITSEKKARDVLVAAAEKGLWRLDATFLMTLARHLQLDLPGGPSLLQLLMALVRSILKVDDEECLAFLERRLAEHASSNRHAAELLEVEELDGVLESGDVKVLTDTKQQVKRQLNEAKAPFNTHISESLLGSQS